MEKEKPSPEPPSKEIGWMGRERFDSGEIEPDGGSISCA